jgi:hypothetical protein
MNATETSAITEVVQRVQSWPAPMRISLARQILRTLEGPAAPSKLPRGPSAQVAAMLGTDKPTPDDATIKQWIADYRLEK